MHAERVDGYNPLAVADAIERKKQILLAGKGPVLLDIVTYRISGHSPSDSSSYRTKEEVEMWQHADGIASFGAYLVSNGHATGAELDALRERVKARIRRTVEISSSLEISPRLETTKVDAIGSLMLSNRKVERFDEREPEMLQSPAENPRVLSNARKSRSGVDDKGALLPKALLPRRGAGPAGPPSSLPPIQPVSRRRNGVLETG